MRAQRFGALRAQAAVMDGNKFNTRCREAGEQRLDILEECEVRDGGPLFMRSSRLQLWLVGW